MWSFVQNGSHICGLLVQNGKKTAVATSCGCACEADFDFHSQADPVWFSTRLLKSSPLSLDSTARSERCDAHTVILGLCPFAERSSSFEKRWLSSHITSHICSDAQIPTDCFDISDSTALKKGIMSALTSPTPRLW
jgi:hypothetical protein